MRLLQRVRLLQIAVGVEQPGADVGVEAGLDQSRWGARVAASWGSEDAGVCVQELVVGVGEMAGEPLAADSLGLVATPAHQINDEGLA